MDLAADVEAGLDFVEEEVSFADERRKREVTAVAAASVEEILKTSGERRVYAEEIVTVLYGTANAGKSSIFNMLARREDAIVEDEPGTTRDMLEARVWMGGAEFLLVDTAGVRAPAEVVEEIAVELSHRVARGAQVVLFVVDGSERVTGDAMAGMLMVKEYTPSTGRSTRLVP